MSIILRYAACMVVRAGDNGEEEGVATSRNRFLYEVGRFLKDAELQRKTPPKLICRAGFKVVYMISKKKLGRVQRSIKKVFLILLLQRSIRHDHLFLPPSPHHRTPLPIRPLPLTTGPPYLTTLL
jgi:hypothetical protein